MPGALQKSFEVLDRADDLGLLYHLTDALYRARSLDEVYAMALEAIQTGLDCDRASVLLFNDAGVMEFVAWRGLSDGYRAAVTGHSPWKPSDGDAAPIFVSDIDDTAEPEALKRTIRDEGIRSLAFIPLMAGGFVVGKFMTYYAKPRDFSERERNLAVTIARQVGFSIERRRAEEARAKFEQELRESEERFRLMSEEAPVMIWMSKPDGSCLHLNRMLREFWGVGEHDIETFDWSATMHPEDAEEVSRQIMDGIERRSPVTVKGRYLAADGTYHVLRTTARPRYSPGGQFVGMIGVNVDTTALDKAEAQQRMLIDELNHRVKNTLATVQSLAAQSLRNADSATARDRFEARLTALSGAHQILTERRWESAALAEIVERALAPFHLERRVTVAGPPAALPPRQTLSMSMALHELATNAVKYGALSNGLGTVTVQWERVAAPGCGLRLTWQEQGGPTVTKPSQRGFGSRLIEQNLAADLGGEVRIDYRPEGVFVAIAFDPWSTKAQ
jgi:PAS domain S-box-containing protein